MIRPIRNQIFAIQFVQDIIEPDFNGADNENI